MVIIGFWEWRIMWNLGIIGAVLGLIRVSHHLMVSLSLHISVWLYSFVVFQSDSVSYFLEEIERIARPDYIPTNQDILHCRKATKGISEFIIHINNVPFVFVDVGGQRTQREKWTLCFNSVTSILFLVSSSEFDQVLSEDRCVKTLLF